MKRPARLVAPALVLFAFATPGVTIHALVGHVIAMGGPADVPREFGLSVVAVLALAAVAPLLVFGVVAMETANALRRVGRLRSLSERREAFGIPYVVIEGDDIAMFTGGLKRPAIFVTRGAERTLTPEQFRAGLMHEEAHRLRGDVLDRMLIRATTRVFGCLPGVRTLADALVRRSEYAADRLAIARGATPAALFEAIVTATGVARAEPALGSLSPASRIEAIVDPAAAAPAIPLRGGLSLLGWHIGLPVAAHAATLFGFACATHL